VNVRKILKQDLISVDKWPRYPIKGGTRAFRWYLKILALRKLFPSAVTKIDPVFELAPYLTLPSLPFLLTLVLLTRERFCIILSQTYREIRILKYAYFKVDQYFWHLGKR